MGQFSQAAYLAARPVVESLMHGKPIQDGHRCEARVKADCSSCRREWVFCTASLSQIRAILAKTWRCSDCEAAL